MKRIVRLTESDLARIVRRVISEAAQIGQPLKVGGKTYITQKFGDGNIGYVDQSVPGTAIKDAKIITALNNSTGYNIPPSNGIVHVEYIQKNPGFKTNLRNLI
jgi:hypothetical protein